MPRLPFSTEAAFGIGGLDDITQGQLSAAYALRSEEPADVPVEDAGTLSHEQFLLRYLLPNRLMRLWQEHWLTPDD
jgi:hypothetical protein